MAGHPGDPGTRGAPRTGDRAGAPAPEVLEATCPAESDIERALAWEAFTRYLREHCPEYVDDVLAMLNGSRAPCPVILAKVRKRLKQHVPEADWAWLGEVLG